MKQEATERVLIAIRRILKGEVYLSDRAASRVVNQFVRGSTAATPPPMSALSDRELEVFRLIGQGHGTREIADTLHLSIKTVETYQTHIKDKLSLRNARELVQHAVEWYLTALLLPHAPSAHSGNPR
jgi:DNA-binding NarL/FixJ family response regulator